VIFNCALAISFVGSIAALYSLSVALLGPRRESNVGIQWLVVSSASPRQIAIDESHLGSYYANLAVAKRLRESAVVSDKRDSNQGDHEITPSEVRYWLEFGCWTTLALAPFLYWINGPAVSQDQFVVRIGLIVLAGCGAFGLRAYAWCHRIRS
jgi:hypothetical protein